MGLNGLTYLINGLFSKQVCSAWVVYDQIMKEKNLDLPSNTICSTYQPSYQPERNKISHPILSSMVFISSNKRNLSIYRINNSKGCVDRYLLELANMFILKGHTTPLNIISFRSIRKNEVILLFCIFEY